PHRSATHQARMLSDGSSTRTCGSGASCTCPTSLAAGRRSPRTRFLASTSTLATDPAAARVTVGALAEAFLAIADADGDGRVSPPEFRAFQGGHFPHLTEVNANEAFAHLDTDDDGHLSAEEFIRAIIEYWSSPDPDAPGNWWIGRPIYTILMHLRA